MRAYFLVIGLFFYGALYAQSPRVPSKMKFADITLRIKEDARKEIQKDVDALTRSQKHYEIYVQRARTYFPIIERVFKEEGVPTDYKFLAIQESGLQPDVVSSSNAVGYWQFKDFTAREMGLRVDRNVDERMNIVAASRGAAMYMKKNNKHFFDNWLIALQAYQMGPGAAIKAGGKKYAGQKTMTIDRKTYWYIKKYLAHKVAFEGVSDGKADTPVVEYTRGGNKSLQEISRETGVSNDEIANYNKWLKKGRIPTDKAYAVILPVTSAKTLRLADQTTVASKGRTLKGVKGSYSYEYSFTDAPSYPKYGNRTEAFSGKVTEINGRKAIVAKRGDRAVALATKGDISLSKFYAYNDLKKGSRILEGQVYYLQKKKSKQAVYHHVAREGESLWEIGQLYGLRLKNLKTRNRIRGNGDVESGQIVWLRYIRPANIPIEYKQMEPVAPPPVIVKNEEPVEKPSASTEPVQEMVFASNDSESISLQTDEDAEDIPEWPNSVKAESNQPEAPTSVPTVDVGTKEPVSGKKRVIHNVTSGDTFYSISRKYGVKINDVLAWNGMDINDPLKIDQQLVLEVDENLKGESNSQKPVEEKEDNSEIYYTVKAGDTMYGISRKYNLSVDELQKLNKKEGFVLKTGEQIRVK